ncbi:RHS repeat domain-containing protein [Chryseobacterium indologenes]|uniref:RHS repeat domain-containing protein n=1 Tax=Chryseobacterium indologenes TaxID=253 RepID=UPI001E29F68A|nr:RHS repeat-associated core domain-containing protein [Chryseobacterium indologenes]
MYNEYDQLAFVLPPLAGIRGDIVTNTTKHDELCYQYRYDGRGRLVEKKLPGKGWEYMVYDKQDRLVGTQDANLKAKGQWLYTKYDQFGRVAYTGINTGGTRAQEQTQANTFGSNSVDRGNVVFFNRQGMDVYYGSSDLTYPKSPTWVTLLSLNYYDSYPGYSFNPPFPSTIQGVPTLTATPSSDGRSTNGLPLVSLVKNIEDDNWTKNFTYYDQKGRAIGGYSINHLGGYTKTESLLKFSGKPEYTLTFHKRTQNDAEINIKESFEYDHQERVVRHWHQVNGANKELLAENVYNELGQLQTKNVGNTTGSPLQSVNYQYNIRGWMTKINEPGNLLNKLFAYELRYNNPNSQYSGTARYNGNISQAAWITQSDAVLRNYSYQYDGLNRLIEGRLWDAMNLDRGEYTENLTYDLNGNIGTLKRKGRQFPGYTAPENMDDLAYVYSGNRLTKVDDLSLNPSGYPIGGKAFGYDGNGNMTVQEDKGLSIAYNYLNLPQNIASPQGNTAYVYNADGTKVKKTAGSKVVDYLTGFQYENSTLQFFPTSEGYFDVVKNKYIYNYTDHLGNVRLSYMNSGSGLEIIEESNYYPFGLKHEGYNTSVGNAAYQYKYNGKELQETGMYDYGARFYMPDLGRWGVVDPLAEVNRAWSPYRYAYNNPLRFIDPDGRLEGDPPGFLSRAWKEVKSWFGGNSKGTLEVGQVERVAEGQTRLFGLIQNANVDTNGNSPLENYRQWQNNPGYNNGESFGDRTARLIGAGTLEARRDFASGGMNMFGGYGRAAKAVNAVEEASNLISVKNTAPQVGEAFQNLGATIADGNISLSGRAVTNGRFDFVVTASGELKVGTGHFNLSGGANEVQAAGQLRLFKGQVMEINNASGHYQPSAAEAQQFPTILSNMGVDVSRAKLRTFSVE